MGSSIPAVYLVDDDASVLRSLERLLGGGGFDLHTFNTAEGFLAAHDSERHGCVILDLLMPDMDGLRLQDRLASCGRPIIFLSGHGDLSAGVLAMKAGAVDFLTKPALREELVAAITKALSVDLRERAVRAEQDLLCRRLALLTPRERQVFHLVAAGRLNKQVAAELGTAEKTVKVHRARVMEKLGARSVVDLARIADRTDASAAAGRLDLRGAEPRPL
jgi:FixJ family two-component response regulator